MGLLVIMLTSPKSGILMDRFDDVES